MRVGFDTGPLHGPRSGIGFAVHALHHELLDPRRAADVQVVDYLTSFRARREVGVRRLPLPAALAHRVWSRTDHPAVDRWLSDVDVVHGTNYVVPPVNVPRLVSIYDCWFLRSPEQASAAVQRAGRVMRRAIAHGAHVHTSSHATAAALIELVPEAHPDRVHVVNLGALEVPAPPATAPIPDLATVPFVVAIGTIERRKNLPRLVQAFGQLVGSHPDLHLVIAGNDGDDATAVHAAVDALGVASRRVLFAGRVDDRTRSWLLHNAAVLAYPSLDEGFGFPLLDAMQAGVPVVASTAGSIPEVAADAALLCPPHDVDALAAALVTILDDTAERTRLLAAGDRRWRQFDWRTCADEMVALYRSLAERGN